MKFGSPQWNQLATARERQFFVVFSGSDATMSGHVAIGIVNRGVARIYDPWSGAKYANPSDFGSFTAYPVSF